MYLNIFMRIINTQYYRKNGSAFFISFTVHYTDDQNTTFVICCKQEFIKVYTKNLPIKKCSAWVLIRMKVKMLGSLVNPKGMTSIYTTHPLFKDLFFIHRQGLMIANFLIYLGKIMAPNIMFNMSYSSRTKITVLDRNFVDGATVHTHTLSSIFLRHE